MSFFEFPHTRTYDNDLGWLIRHVNEVEKQMENFISFSTIKYADPIEWDITRQYQQNTIVIDPRTGNAYLSVKPVPGGVAIDDTEYWTPIYNYDRKIYDIEEQIVPENEKTNTHASEDRKAGDLIWINDILYKVLNDIQQGTEYIENVNIVSTNLLHESMRNTPEYFGAVGDGVTDDTEAINKCMEYNRLVIFLHSDYAITDTIITGNNRVIYANNATLHRKSGIFSMVKPGSDTTIKDLHLNGHYIRDNLSNEDPAQRFSGFDLNNVTNVNLENCTVRETVNGEFQENSTAGAFYLHNNTSFVSMVNCAAIENFGTGFFAGDIAGAVIQPTTVSNITITNCYGYKNRGSSISGSFSKLLLSGFISWESGYSGISINGTDTTITGCESYYSTYSGFNIGHTHDDNFIGRNITLSNCISAYSTLDGLSIGAGDICNVSNFISYDNSRDGIRIMEYDNIVNIDNVLLKEVSCFRVYKGNVKLSNSKLYGSSNVFAAVGTSEVDMKCSNVDFIFTAAASPTIYGLCSLNSPGDYEFADCYFDGKFGINDSFGIMIAATNINVFTSRCKSVNLGYIGWQRITTDTKFTLDTITDYRYIGSNLQVYRSGMTAMYVFNTVGNNEATVLNIPEGFWLNASYTFIGYNSMVASYSMGQHTLTVRSATAGVYTISAPLYMPYFIRDWHNN